MVDQSSNLYASSRPTSSFSWLDMISNQAWPSAQAHFITVQPSLNGLKVRLRTARLLVYIPDHHRLKNGEKPTKINK